MQNLDPADLADTLLDIDLSLVEFLLATPLLVFVFDAPGQVLELVKEVLDLVLVLLGFSEDFFDDLVLLRRFLHLKVFSLVVPLASGVVHLRFEQLPHKQRR